MKKHIIIILGIMCVLQFLVGCGNKSEKTTVTLADQFGLAYAPLEIMKSQQFYEAALEKRGLDIDVVWKRFGNTMAIREAMLSEDLDIGFVGIPPFLIGLENGMDWRIITGLSESRVALVTKDDTIEGIEAISKDHKIILPQAGSIQHILLQMAAFKTFGDAHRFDAQLVALSHPDGVIAFTAGDEKQLHFTTPPFLQEDLKVAGARVILDEQTSFGEAFTFIVGICPTRFYEETEMYEAFLEAMDETFLFMQNEPDAAFEILLKAYEYESEDLAQYLSENQLRFGSDIKGLDTFVEFMLITEQVKTTYTQEVLTWPREGSE